MPAFAKQPDEFSPFSFHAPDDVLSDLKRRLQTVRFPEAATEPGFAQGPQIEKLQVLTTYWRDRYDWRRTEVRLNGWPQFKTEIDGLGIHFLHVRSKQENA
ncbi:epoxide hydrolase, partial [Mesorhizobium sp. M2D.F.Ca.ET.145.01.1.1]